MADVKITALTAISANPVNPATFPMPMVDLLDTSMAASGTTKKVTVNQILGAGGTATLASATITGDLTVRTNKLAVTSTGVGIGMTPITPLSGVIGTTGAIFFRTTDPAAAVATPYIQAPASTGFSSTSPAYGFWYQACGIGNPALNNVSIITDSTERVKVGSTGDVNISTGNVVMGTSGKGIDFTATAEGSGTMTSELLNDYEEGTFTPTVRGSTVAGTGVYTTQAGLYTKVGRLVTITVYLNWTAVTLGTGNLQFAGLPFTASSSPVTYNGISIGFVSNIATTAGTVLYGIVEPGSTVITMTQTPTGGGAYGLVPLDTSGEIAFTSTYYV